MNEMPIKLSERYISNRTQFVRVKKKFKDKPRVEFGLPQGNVLLIDSPEELIDFSHDSLIEF